MIKAAQRDIKLSDFLEVCCIVCHLLKDASSLLIHLRELAFDSSQIFLEFTLFGGRESLWASHRALLARIRCGRGHLSKFEVLINAAGKVSDSSISEQTNKVVTRSLKEVAVM